MKNFYIFLISLFMVSGAMAQTNQPCSSCLPEGITFSTQAQIDNFQANYPGCTVILGKVTISGADITNLNGLNVLTTIGSPSSGGDLWIYSNSSLNNLTALNHLVTIGGELIILNNAALTSLTGLGNLASTGHGLSIIGNGLLSSLEGLEGLNNTSGRLLIHDNNALISLLGLDNMTSIGGELSIYGNAALSSLLGLEGLNHISGGCIIHDNNALISLTGLDNVTYIGGYFDIYSNDALTSLTGLEGLNDFGSGSIIIHDNNALTSLTGLDNITNIGFFSIYSNDVLTSLTGLDNLTSIAFYLSIYDNSSLSICNNQWLCNYLSNPNGSVLIYNNAPGCNSVIDLALSCGNAPCLPYGNYYFTSQTDIDNFQTAFPDCSTLNGYVIINGVGITNLTGLNNVASIADDLMIYGNSLNSLTGLDDLISIGGNLVIEHNGTLINVLGLEGLTSIGGSLSIWTNNALVNLTGLDNLISTGGYIEIADNGALTSLTGLDNVKANTISNLSIYSNLSLSTCDIKSICNYLAAPNGDVYIEGNAPGCNSPEEVQEACQAAIEEINASELTIIPNPAKDHITIEIPSTENIVSAELTDLQGRMVKKVGHCSGSKTVIDIYGVPKGLYLLIVITDKNIYSNKVIVN